MLVIQ